MDQHLFSFLPGRLNLNIFNKLTPISYVRLRRSCHEVDNFCESNRCYLRVRFKGSYHGLVLTNYSYDGPNLTQPRVEATLGERDKHSKTIVTSLANQKSSDLLRSAISGFHFDEIIVEQYQYIPRNAAVEEEFEKAAGYFAEATISLKSPRSLNFTNMPSEFVEQFGKRFNLRHIFVSTTTLEFLDTVVYQKTKFSTLHLYVDTIDLVNIVRNKERVWLTLRKHQSSYISHISQLLPQLIQLLQEWKHCSLKLKYLQVQCESGYFDTANSDTLRTVKGVHFLGYYCLRKWSFCRLGNSSPRNHYKEYWLYQRDDGRWGLIQLYWDNAKTPSVIFTLKDVTTPDGFSLEELCLIVEEMYTIKKIPVDSSKLYEEFHGLCPADVGNAIRQQVETLRKMQYKGCGRRHETR